jgi:hypothetical protein
VVFLDVSPDDAVKTWADTIDSYLATR